MNRAARVCLAAVVVLVLISVLLVVPNPARLSLPAGAQVPIPTLSELLDDPEPSKTKSGGGSGKSGGGSGKSGGGSGKSGGGSGGTSGPGLGGLGGGSGNDDGPRRPGGGIFVGPYTPTGSWSTTRLIGIAARLQGLGFAPAAVNRKVYRPFIVGGDAAWSNTWGAPRFGPGKRVRTHQGQDVFCHFGAPVLASEDGRIEFGQGGLGGRVARLYRADGSYWYYAHLADWNTRQFYSGARVRAGDVIGFCGNTGNAVGTAPHVHFGWYRGGTAIDPNDMLIRWLNAAERRASRLLDRIASRRIARYDQLVLARRFGDPFTPDRSELRIGGLARGSSSFPASGPYALAMSALRVALTEDTLPKLPKGSAGPVRPATQASDPARFITRPRRHERAD